MPDLISAVAFNEKTIDAIVAELDQCHLPGAAIGIAIQGKPVYRKGFGLASMELPIILSPSTRMRIGSTTKHFAALAYMLLCEDGKAGIDDPIGKYLPELHPVTHNVTIRQLMGHIGGLRDAIEIVWQFGGTGQPVSSAELLSLYRSIDDVNFAPGTAWCYNNGGYLMLSIAIERITGQSLEDVLYERIFKPAGMYNTLLRRWDTTFVPNSATLHTSNLFGEYQKSYLGTALTGEGGMVSTIDDMLLWLAHIDAPVVGTVQTWNVMKEPLVLVNGTSTGYGLGLRTGYYRGIETLHHGGGVMGGNSQMLKVPAAGLDVVIMLNRDDIVGAVLVEKILDACLPGLAPAEKSSRVPARFASGVFRSPATGRVVQLFAKNQQQIVSIDGLDLQVESDKDGVLFPVDKKLSVQLVGDLERPNSIRFCDFGNLDELFAIQPQKGDATSIAGRYRSDTTCAEAVIYEAGNVLRLQALSPFGSQRFDLENFADGIWRAKPKSWWPPGGVLSFNEGNRMFQFTSARTWSLPFRRVE